MYPETKILIIDNDEVFVKTLIKCLVGEGYDVDVATSPALALEMIREKKYHIALIEIVMPEMDGIDVLEAIKAYDALIQVIMMTGQSRMDMIVRCLEKGATDYLIKPVKDPEQVLEAIRSSESKLRHWWDCMRSTFPAI